MSKPKIILVNGTAAKVITTVTTNTSEITMAKFVIPGTHPYVVRTHDLVTGDVQYVIPSQKLTGPEILEESLEAAKTIISNEQADEALKAVLGMIFNGLTGAL